MQTYTKRARIVNADCVLQRSPYGIYGRKMYETWYKMTQLVLSGFPLGKVMTHQLPIDRFQEGFDLMEAGKAGKVVLSWN